MTMLVALKGRELEARACGSCAGSSSDNKIRPQADDLPPLVPGSVPLAAADAAGVR